METTVVESHGLEDLVFGVVAPIGTDLNSVSFAMSNTLRGMGYDTNVIQLSSLLTEVKDRFQLTLESSPEEKRYETYMTAGNAFREAMRRGDALSMLAVGAIGALRSKFVQKKRAFILRSLKHPDEVKSLRNIYGPAFVLFSINSSRTTRVENLAKKFNKSHGGFVSADYRSVADRKTLLKHASNWDSTVASPQLGEYPKRTQLINLVTEKIAFDQFRSELKEYTHGDD